MAKKAIRTIVGAPLTPELLDDLGALKDFKKPSDDFEQNGEGTRMYRVWTCHGYRESGNADQGWLRLEKKKPADPSNNMVLAISQDIMNDRGQSHVQYAWIHCRKDDINSLIQWRHSSFFIGPDGNQKPELEVEESARVDKEGVKAETKQGDRMRPGALRLASNWTLFEALARHPFDARRSVSFDFLEELSVLREGHRLTYRGASETKLNGIDMRLHRFQQLGRGALPYEYWLDDDHRLAMVFTMNRAYILDPDAMEKGMSAREKMMEEYFRAKNRDSKGGASNESE